MIDQTPFKLKYGGMKLTARRMTPDEIIDKKSLRRFKGYSHNMSEGWLASACVGDRAADHPDWEYIIILSPFFEGESTS